jgi:hypothetical protein
LQSSAQTETASKRRINEDLSVVCAIVGLQSTLMKDPAFGKGFSVEGVPRLIDLTKSALKSPELKAAYGKRARNTSLRPLSEKFWKEVASDAGIKDWSCSSMTGKGL